MLGPARDRPHERGRCRIVLYWIKAPLARRGPAAQGDAFAAVSDRAYATVAVEPTASLIVAYPASRTLRARPRWMR